MLLLYRLFRFLPCRRRIVCMSRESDQCPTDFALIKRYIDVHHPDYQVVVLAKQLRSPLTYLPHMVKQLYMIATSQAVLLDTYAIVVSMLAGYIDIPVIQMWHALGNMKKFGYTALDKGEGRDVSTASLLGMHKGYTSILISSTSFIDDYAAGFGVDTSLIHEAPLPRVDLLTDPAYRQYRRAQIINVYPQLGRKKNIVYCPTFRKRVPHNQKAALAALAAAVDFNRYNLIVKAHPLDTVCFDDPRVIQHYDRRCDMLYVADYVISDYSTVIYEAGLLDLPVYLYAYDWTEYSTRRSLYIDPERDIPTLFTADVSRIVSAIENDNFDVDAYRAFIRKNVAVPAEGTCTQHVVDYTFDLIKRNHANKSNK